jgi:hypothetical protein
MQDHMDKEKRRIESRNRILSTAEKYFAEKKINEADIIEICQQAGWGSKPSSGHSA